MNEQVKAGIAALKDFLGGHSTEEEIDDPRPPTNQIGSERSKTGNATARDPRLQTQEGEPVENQGTGASAVRKSASEEQSNDRQALTAEKGSAEQKTSGSAEDHSTSKPNSSQPHGPALNSQSSAQSESSSAAKTKAQADSIVEHKQQGAERSRPADSANKNPQQADDAEQVESKDRSVDDESFEAAVEILRAAGPSAERAAAARALGLQGSQRGTPHLIAAMFDEDPDVRTAAEEALAKLGEPTFKQSASSRSFDEASTPQTRKQSASQTSPTQQSAKQSTTADASKRAESSETPKQSSAAETTTENSKMMQPPSNAQQSSAAPPAKSVVAHAPRKDAHAQSKEVTPTKNGGHAAKEMTQATDLSPRDLAAATPGEKGLTDQTAKDALATKETQRGQATPHKAKAGKAETLTALAPDASEDEQQFFLEERSVRQRLELIEQQLTEKSAARTEAENEAQWHRERESKLLADAAAQRVKEEELRKKAEEEAADRRKREAQAIAAEQAARAKADADAERLATTEVRLRNEIAKLTRSAEELKQRRLDAESARLTAAATARQTEAQRARDEAERTHKAELDRLRNEQGMLETATEKANARRAEVHAARERAERDAEALAQAQARMREAEDARTKAEAERVRLEAELNIKVETEEALLVAARQRAQEEQARLEEEARRHRESEERRMADLEATRKQAELEAKQRAEREHQIRSQLDTLRIADAEVRKRTEEAEVRRRAAEEAYRLVAEKVQRVEAEAHASKLEEEQILAKLEAARRNAAVEAQARAEQEKRIKEEIEMLRRLEEEERPRLEALMLQRSTAETRLQQARERFRAEEEARVRAEEQIESLGEYQRVSVEAELVETPKPLPLHAPAFADSGAAAVAEAPSIDVELPVAPNIPAAISSYLHSVDPYKRAAAVAELARSQPVDAFALIARSFDDHSPHVRNAAARALRKLEPQKSVDLFNRALEEGPDERRKNIGSAIAASGLASEAIDNLVSENREETYNALSILFVMAKTGEVQPLVQAIEEHENEEVCRAVIKLLTLSGQSELGDAALQRRVMGVAASRQKAANKHDEIPDFRMRIAEVEVKRALNHQAKSESE